MKTLWCWFKRFTKYCFIGFLLLMLGISVFLWYTTTESFQQMVRTRIIAELKQATGGRVELGGFHVVPLKLRVEVHDLTIHGRERAGEAPYFHVDSIAGTVKLSSALGARLGFHKLILNRPVIHLLFYADGSSNLPSPKQGTDHLDFNRLFSISVSRLEVHNGEALYQDQRVPLDFTSNDVSANVYFSFIRQRYSGDVQIGRAETLFDGYRPVAWSGEAAFAADRDGVEIRSAKAGSGSSNVQFRGTLTNFHAPIIQGSYTVNVDLAQAAAISRQPHLENGMLQLTGNGSWSADKFFSDGKFTVTNFAWQDSYTHAKQASASGKFTLDPQKIAISEMQGEFLRGSFGGEAEISNWQNQHPANAKVAKSSEQQGSVKLKLKDISLADALASLGPQLRPVNKLRFAGNVSGTTDLRWRQSIANTEATVALNVIGPSRVSAGYSPLNADARLSYNFASQNLAVTNLSATSAASQIHASGALTRASSMNLSFATTDFHEWQPFMSEIFSAGVPLGIHGRASFDGIASGNPQNLLLAGNVTVDNFDVHVPDTKPEQQVHWDLLTTNVQASARNLSLRGTILRHGNTAIRGDGNVALVNWRLVPESVFRAHIDVQNARAEEIAVLAGYDHSMSGTLAGAFDLSGTASHVSGQGTAVLKAGTVRGYPFDSATTALTLNGNQVAFQNAVVVMGQSRVTASGKYDRESKKVDLQLDGASFDLAKFTQLQNSRVQVAGVVDFSAAVSGSVALPNVNASVHVRNLSLNGESEGDYLLTGTSQGTDLHLSGHSQFKSSDLQLEGNIRLEQRWPARIDVHFNHLDVDPLIQTYLRGQVTGHSAVSGSFTVQGPLLDHAQLNVTGTISEVQANVEKLQLYNDGPIDIRVANEALNIDKFHFVGDGTDFTGGGSIQLPGEHALDLHVSGNVGVGMLHAYNPDFISSGYVNAETQIAGTLDSPLLKGKLQIQNAAISDINLPTALSDVNGTLTFNQNRVTIETLTARTGGGTITLGGHADIARRQITFDLTASAQDVRLRYPPGVSSTATADLHWLGSNTGSQLTGDITITKLGFTPGFDFGTYLQRSAQAASLPQTDPLLNGIRLDLHVATTPELQMQTSVIRLEGEADLRVRGNAAKPVLLGRADVFEGEAYFNGTKYRLERGGVTFNNPTLTTPNLDLQATTRVRDYEVTLSITGNATNPKLSYRSDPPLPTSDIISLLAFGQTQQESAQLQQNSNSAFSQQTSSAILGAALNATLNNRAQRLFGNSRIKIDPQGLATETSPTQNGPAVTIEQQVKDNLTLAYTTDVAQTSQQVIRAEYNITRNISIVAIRDQNGVVSFDVRIRRRHR